LIFIRSKLADTTYAGSSFSITNVFFECLSHQ
jgi:hypothetical protein